MCAYLDNCCYNRPFDPQDQLRVAIETSAKMRVQALIDTIWHGVIVRRCLSQWTLPLSHDREPQDYTEWRKNQFEDDGETIEELGAKIRCYSEARRGKPVSV